MSESLEKIIDVFTLSDWINIAKSYTARYSINHKGKNQLEKECIKKGYLIKKRGEIFPDCIESEKNKIGVFALDFNQVNHKGGFILVY